MIVKVLFIGTYNHSKETNATLLRAVSGVELQSMCRCGQFEVAEGGGQFVTKPWSLVNILEWDRLT